MMKEFIQKTTIFSNNHSFAAEITMPSQRIFKSVIFKSPDDHKMLRKIQPHLAAKRKEFSAAVREFQKKKKNI